MKQKIIIRPIGKNDDSSLAQIIRLCFEEFGAPKEGTVYSDPSTDFLYRTFNSQPHSGYLVLETQNDSGEKIILGGCGYYPTPALPDGYAELVKFYLHPCARGKGYGKKLICRILELMWQEGYTKAYIESFPEFKNAVSLYEKLGFLHLDHALGNSGHFACTIHMEKQL